MTFGDTKNFNIKCKSKGCKNLTNKLSTTGSFDDDVIILLCDSHRDSDKSYATLPYLIEEDGKLKAKCFSCGNIWIPQTFKERKYNKTSMQYGDVPSTCAKCRSPYWRAPHKAVMRGWH